MINYEPKDSKVKGFDPEKFNKSLSMRPKLRDMKVGQQGYIFPGALVFLKNGNLYLNVSYELVHPLEDGETLEYAVAAVKRVSQEENGYNISFSKMDVIDYNNMVYVRSIEDYLKSNHWAKKEDLILIENMTYLFSQMATIKRTDNPDDKSTTSD